jgi:hypothetical protein
MESLFDLLNYASILVLSNLLLHAMQNANSTQPDAIFSYHFAVIAG